MGSPRWRRHLGLNVPNLPIHSLHRSRTLPGQLGASLGASCTSRLSYPLSRHPPSKATPHHRKYTCSKTDFIVRPRLQSEPEQQELGLAGKDLQLENHSSLDLQRPHHRGPKGLTEKQSVQKSTTRLSERPRVLRALVAVRNDLSQPSRCLNVRPFGTSAF